MAASPLLKESLAVAAELARVVFYNDISSVVSDNVVCTVAQEFHTSRVDEFAGFLVHYIALTRSRHK
jgi:hypothetical protein